MLGSPEPDDIPSVSQLQRQGRVKAMDGIKVANQLIWTQWDYFGLSGQPHTPLTTEGGDERISVRARLDSATTGWLSPGRKGPWTREFDLLEAGKDKEKVPLAPPERAQPGDTLLLAQGNPDL